LGGILCYQTNNGGTELDRRTLKGRMGEGEKEIITPIVDGYHRITGNVNRTTYEEERSGEENSADLLQETSWVVFPKTKPVKDNSD